MLITISKDYISHYEEMPVQRIKPLVRSLQVKVRSYQDILAETRISLVC